MTTTEDLREGRGETRERESLKTEQNLSLQNIQLFCKCFLCFTLVKQQDKKKKRETRKNTQPQHSINRKNKSRGPWVQEHSLFQASV